ncbi:ribosomal protein S5 domain 2-type protein [Cokeromyces recurvatus]|uniref:ribosomal protein S5 domain 2-type protein n=1 Tax=Cokeromyces recurvatus TaxID=90255 RepID=UPI0022209A4F|nr:ribosomal protein S5 domain 2-type protein [Cokeromyces recurvatus]KAI7897654.1 ribosomal protein S5 domain 2-type protein [Cokeromyces recurvatus]
MNKEQELENRQLQNEEIMALEAIYPDDFHKDETSSDAYIFTLNLDQDDDTIRSPRKVILRFFLPPTYPNQDMPIYEIASIYCGTKKLDNDMLEAIDVGFTSLFMPTQVVLFEWISWLRDYLEEHVEKYVIEEETEISNALSQLQVEEGNVDEEEEEEIYDFNPEDHYKKETSAQQDDSHDRPTVRSLMGPNSYHTETPPSIFSSEPLVDRKSIFVAHVAQVHTIHQVKVVVAHLLQNKKIAKATHNILAYRITMPDGKVLQDNDDDGESAAGGRLSHLMQILEVENVVVVVTRWFGGIHLGPDRFKDINNIARSALSECGFIKDKHENKHKKKK